MRLLRRLWIYLGETFLKKDVSFADLILIWVTLYAFEHGGAENFWRILWVFIAIVVAKVIWEKD